MIARIQQRPGEDEGRSIAIEYQTGSGHNRVAGSAIMGQGIGGTHDAD